MNAFVLRTGIRNGALALTLAAAAAAIPAVALGDPPAVGAPTIPGPFVGAPTNSDPNAGQFSVDVTHRKIGRAADRYDDLVHAAPLVRHQAKNAVPSIAQRRAVDRVFVSFAERLKAVATPQTALSNETGSSGAR